jgi:quinol monooxygenase YgiN
MVTGGHGNVSGPGEDDEEDIVFAVTRFRARGDDARALAAAVPLLMGALAARPGFLHGELGRCADDPDLWALVTRWDGVGSYRRALSNADVKFTGAPVWVHALDEPGVYLPEDDVAHADRDA